jgi:hypothetical protein
MTWATVGAASRAKNAASGKPSLLIDVGTSAILRSSATRLTIVY